MVAVCYDCTSLSLGRDDDEGDEDKLLSHGLRRA